MAAVQCPRCGAINPAHSEHCLRCNTSLAGSVHPSQMPPGTAFQPVPGHAGRMLFPPGLVAGLSLAFLGGVMILWGFVTQ